MPQKSSFLRCCQWIALLAGIIFSSFPSQAAIHSDTKQLPESLPSTDQQLWQGDNDKDGAPKPRPAPSDSVPPAQNKRDGSPTQRATDPSQPAEQKGIDWRNTLRLSFSFLVVEPAFRLATERGTRADLKGPFFRDWFDSVRNLRGWRDGDPFIVNYIGHPMQGAVSGYILIQNDPRGRRQHFGDGAAYWHSRLKAAGWNLLYSTQFEIGPLSECSMAMLA